MRLLRTRRHAPPYRALVGLLAGLWCGAALAGQPPGVPTDGAGAAIPAGGLGSPPAAAGQATGTTDLPIKGVRINLLGWDGSTQARVSTLHGATEFVELQGGNQGLGPVIKAGSDVDLTVPLNFYTTGTADFWFNSGGGTLLHLASPAFAYNWPRFTGSASTYGAYLEAEGGDANIDVGLIPKGSGGITNRRHLGDIATNNPMGTYAIDLQFGPQNAATQTASGSYAILIGGSQSVASALRSTCINCQGAVMDGFASSAIDGLNISANGRKGWHGYGIAYIQATGDAQAGRQTLVGKTTSSAGVRMTTDGLAATVVAQVRNCLFIPPKSTSVVDLTIAAIDRTNVGHHAAWKASYMLSEDAAASSFAVTLISGAVTAGDAIGVSVTADTTLGCVNLTATPPVATATDQWDFSAVATGPEVQ
jgi:hypothetical protein